MKTSIAAGILWVALLCLAIACKKDKNDKSDKIANCRLKSYLITRAGDTTIYEFSYNNEGKVISTRMTYSGGIVIDEFTYTGNTIIGLAKNGGNFFFRDSITLDARGRAINIRRYSGATGTSWENTAWEFNGDILSKIYTSNNSSPTPGERIVTYANGNIASIQSATNTATYEYYPDKIQVGDYLTIRGMTDYGFGLYPNQNLLKSLTSGGSTTTVNYEMNADGLIATANVIAAGNAIKYSYAYECK